MASPLASTSLSRSQMSPEDIAAMADAMMRSSLSRERSSPLPSVPISSESLSRRRNVGSSADNMLRQSLSKARGIPTSSSTRSIITNSKSGLTHSKTVDSAPPPYATLYGTSLNSVSRSDPVKLKQELQRELDAANAQVQRSGNAGLFKEACSTDLLFVIDTTNSMGPYIDAAREQVKDIVADVQRVFFREADVRIAVVSYKDHKCDPHIQFLDFTSSADEVHDFLDQLDTDWGRDFPEDVLGGLNQALNASWKQQTRCIVHIGDAPAHGRPMHDFPEDCDDYYVPGSEPHGLTHEPILKKLIQLNINYAFLRITAYTDRMAMAFAELYGPRNAKLSSSNKYCYDLQDAKSTVFGSTSVGGSVIEPQFEELELGIKYDQLRHLVVKTVTSSFSRTANRLTMTAARDNHASNSKMFSPMRVISENDNAKTSQTRGSDFNNVKFSGSSASARRIGEVTLEKALPQWDDPNWFEDTFDMQGFCPTGIHNAAALNEMMDADENIKLSVAELTVHARAKPFNKGAMRTASYARSAYSDNPFVVKSFLKSGRGQAHVAEDMRIQALCKAFALEFNGLVKVEPPLDFVVTSCLQSKSKVGSKGTIDCLSLEPFIEGDYIKYNTNGAFLNKDVPDKQFGEIAQAFSHFTFERSWGHLLVSDLQGVGHVLTDPAIQTQDPGRFKLNDGNLGADGFKFFFCAHECNSYCEQLGLKSTAEGLMDHNLEFRETWPMMEPTLCCSNMFCRSIVLAANAKQSETYPDYSWCDRCYPQLESYTVCKSCSAPGSTHEFEVSNFFYESQGQLPPTECPDHRRKLASESSAASLGGSLYSRMKSKQSTESMRGSVSGRAW